MYVPSEHEGKDRLSRRKPICFVLLVYAERKWKQLNFSCLRTCWSLVCWAHLDLHVAAGLLYSATQASGRRRRMPDLNSQSKQHSSHRQNPRQQHGRRIRWIGFEYVGNECNKFLQPTMLEPLSVFSWFSWCGVRSSAYLDVSCPSWQWHRTGSRWSPVRTLPVAPLWCDLGFVPNSRGNKAAANPRPGSWWTYTGACDKIKYCRSTC